MFLRLLAILYLITILLSSHRALSAEGAWILGPGDGIYEEYLADPRRPRTGINEMLVIDSELGDRYDVGDARFDLQVGERFIVLQHSSLDSWSIDLAVEAGFFGQFDQIKTLDAIGWDGWYALHAAFRRDEKWAYKLALRHLSSHVGDELIERVGIKRRGYTREEITAALQWTPGRGETAAYLELGYAFLADGDPVEPLMAQTGVQYAENEPGIWHNWVWGIGIDVQFFEDNDFEPNVNVALALRRPSKVTDEAFELRAAFYTGRSQIGEFSNFDETYVSFGIGWNY